MNLPLQITFRDFEASSAIEARIRDHARKLETFYDRITACHVIVEERTRRRRKGNLFHVRIDMAVPGKEIVVQRDPAVDHAHEDLYVALRDAFQAASRQLQDYASRRRGGARSH